MRSLFGFFRLAIMETTSRFYRLLCTGVYLVFISYTICIVLTLGKTFLNHPTVTTMVSSTYPVSKIPFPGVSICGINKISKKKSQNLALHIANMTGHNPDKITSYMNFIGQLHDFDFDPSTVSELLEFQNILDSLKISVIELTKQLSIQCEDLLWKCFWRNMEVNCSSLFKMRLTYHGYCCVFNYVKATQELESIGELKLTDAGLQNGLYVSVTNNPDDYRYTTISSPGVMIYIFSPTDYPDKPSGGLSEIITKPNSENFVEVVPTVFTAVDDVTNYPLEKRACIFRNERTTILSDFYTQSDCNVDCRIRSIQAMCQCIPFIFPLSNSSNVCTLADLPCLNKYREKWNSFYPFDDFSLLLEKEKQDSLRCDNRCFPRCNKIAYKVQTNAFPIFRYRKSNREQNVTHIYVYFPYRFFKEFRQDVVYYWFEILSNFGGIFGIFLGWSIISIMQVLGHYLKRLGEMLILSCN